MDLATKKQADNWRSFISGKGAKKQSGVAPKKSMFAVPDGPNARVGVIGSGRAMTDGPERKRMDF